MERRVLIVESQNEFALTMASVLKDAGFNPSLANSAADAARKRVLDAYDAAHRISSEGADKAVLTIGTEDWPFPIPLVRKDGSWSFDTAAGREEILARRIGRNELSTIQADLEAGLADMPAGDGVPHPDPDAAGWTVREKDAPPTSVEQELTAAFDEQAAGAADDGAWARELRKMSDAALRRHGIDPGSASADGQAERSGARGPAMVKQESFNPTMKRTGFPA